METSPGLPLSLVGDAVALTCATPGVIPPFGSAARLDAGFPAGENSAELVCDEKASKPNFQFQFFEFSSLPEDS